MKHRFAVFFGARAALIVAVLLVYSNVIHGEFQFDDEEFINSSLEGVTPAAYLNKTGLFGLLAGQRILTILTFALNYRMGGLEVSGYHLFNIALHVVAVILAIGFLRSLSTLTVDGIPNKSGAVYSLLCAVALFAVHPLQTQAVSYVVQRGEVLASIFYLAVLISLIKFTRANGVGIVLWWLASFVFFIAGWISKEIVITVPFAYLLCVLYANNAKYFKRAMWGVIPYLSAGIILVFYKLSLLRGAKDAGFSSFAPGTAVYAMTQMKVVLHYMRLFLLPSGQNIDHDIPLVTSLMSPEGLGLLIFWIILLVGCFFVLLRCRENRFHYLRTAAFGIVWMVVLLLPTSSIIPIVDPMYEHRMYLPLLGLSMTVVFLVKHAVDRLFPHKRHMVITLILMVALPGLGYAAHERNKVWLTMESLWLDASQKSPQKSRPFNNLGNCYLLKGRYQDAVVSYRKAISLDPANTKSYYNISLALKNLGQMEEAFMYYQKFLELADRERGR